MTMRLSAHRLREVLAYEPETGVFTRRVATARSVKVGEVAGSAPKHNGYIHLAIDGEMYLAHRLAWLYVHGEWPAHHIDHINGVRHDNRICNLRDVTRMVNNQNQRRAMSTNKSTGLLGAHFHRASGRFMSSIRANGAQKHLGYFKTPEQAHAAYVTAKRDLHDGCTI